MRRAHGLGFDLPAALDNAVAPDEVTHIPCDVTEPEQVAAALDYLNGETVRMDDALRMAPR